ncbi:MAG: hypothetical protein DRI90_12255 [Deltaproteobacteria bacterium]|nr:MAG: hypothetical protein DRI90_12255 [Deltaproteobacteria bacterium]
MRKKGEIEDQLENLRVGLASIQEEGKQQLVALGLYHGSVDQAETVAVPLRKTIERFARELAEIDTKLSTSVSKVDEVRRRQGEDQHKLDELHRGGVLPSATDLAAVRTRREDAWQKVRGAWMGPLQRGEDQVDPAIATPASATALAATYEKSVTQADDVADALREHAALVTKVAFLKEQIRSANSDLAVLERQRDPHDKSRAELDLKWSGLWSKPGIDDPLPPSEMLEWLDRFDELRNTSKAIRKCGIDVTKLERAISVYIEDLGEQLTELGAPAPREDESLAALLDRCDRLVAQVGEERKEREEQHKAIVDGEGELARMVEEADRAEQKLAQWQLQWDKAMAALRCSPESSAAQANTRIGLLQALFKDLDDAAALNARIESMQDGQLQFEKDVSRMAKLVAEDLASVPAAQAANELASRTKRANRDVDRLAELQERAKGLEDDLRDVEEPRRTAQEALASLCKLAGVDRDDQLAVTEEASTAKRDLQERLRTTDEELLGLGGGISVEELIEQASGKDASSLTANIEALDDTIKNAEKVLETASGDVRDAQREIEFVDGSATAAEADQEMLGIVGRAHEAAEQYIRLRLAASLLRRHVEDQRAKTQDPVLQRARELFRKLTCGSFADLKIDYDPDDKPFLLGDRGDGSEPVPLEGFSDGTADQLYLALRIAYLERNLASGEPMPIIADDILVNFDDQRARATLEVLTELSHKTQVLLLTHHDHLRALARDVVPADALFEHEIPTAQTDD